MSRDHEIAALPASLGELCRKRWHSMTGAIPDDAVAMIERGEYFFAALLLLEVVTAGHLVRWRVTFSNAGASYECCFWLKEQAGRVRQFCGRDEASLTLSLVAALDRFWTGDAGGPE